MSRIPLAPSPMKLAGATLLRISYAHQSLRKSACHLTARHCRTTPNGRPRHAHEAAERSVVESTGFFTATETFGANSDDVSVWEHAGFLFAGRFELCVAIHTTVVQLSMILRANSLSVETVNEYPRSVRFFMKYCLKSQPASRRTV